MNVQLQLPDGRVAVESRALVPRVGQLIHDPSSGRRFRAVEGDREQRMVELRGVGRRMMLCVPVVEVPATDVSLVANSSRRGPFDQGRVFGAGGMPFAALRG